ncbi:tryptophan synthase alpha chain active site [Lucifera butyrica]|uniref:Tryptophan synthase alpha chain n=1 Tax=Lucifera butyrica TaxID=1351585 RepID=A0A498R5C3_9FIRM|nr:tryptophan synthase subunit alpha [Lucifera butyrica]VBB06654.1 tryptophan synthase alpha chain active site [Lucifera butyrica]
MDRKNAIQNRFRDVRQTGKKALITYISAGDPDLDTTRKLVLTMEKNGTDIIELGVPFSDPVADGPVIQAASLRALQKGITIEKIFNLVRSLRQETAIPLILMVYFNSILQYGIERFTKACAGAGVDGLIVPDLPLEESEELRQTAAACNVDVIMLVAPTTPLERVKQIARVGKGFLYCVSVTGVTGMQKELDGGLAGFLTMVRSQTDLPLAVGFGISTPAQAATAAKLADGVIVGSAVIKVIENHLAADGLVEQVGAFVSRLKQGLADGITAQ